MKSNFKLNPYFYLLTFLVLTGCYSVEKAVIKSKPGSDKINWPETYQPQKSQFFVHNEIDIQASPQKVWQILIQAERWPDWYIGAKDVKILDETSTILKDDSVFYWKTMGQRFESVIKEFEEPYRLSWESKKSTIQGYHAWLIIPTAYGCRVITSESQSGFLTFMQKVFIPNKLENLHQLWLEEIKQKAESDAL